MVELNSNIRLIDFTTGKRGAQKTEKRQEPDVSPTAEATGATNTDCNLYDRVVLQFPKGRGIDFTGEVPTREEANDALESLVRDLSSSRQDLGQVHEFADRRRVMSLLSPLVED